MTERRGSIMATAGLAVNLLKYHNLFDRFLSDLFKVVRYDAYRRGLSEGSFCHSADVKS